MRDGLLSELYYALGEAKMNTILAKEMDVRDFAKDEYDEDIELFDDLRDELMGEMFGDKLQERKNP